MGLESTDLPAVVVVGQFTGNSSETCGCSLGQLKYVRICYCQGTENVLIVLPFMVIYIKITSIFFDKLPL